MPWTRRLPSAYLREHVRFTTQPLDAPPDAAGFAAGARPDRLGRDAHASRPTTRTGIADTRCRGAFRRSADEAALAAIMSAERPEALPAGRREVSDRHGRERLIDCDVAQRAARRRRRCGRTCPPSRATGARRLDLPVRRRSGRCARTSATGSYIGAEYPRADPDAARATPGPRTAGRPASDLDFIRQQLLDAWDMEFGDPATRCSALGEQLNLELRRRARPRHQRLADGRVARPRAAPPRLDHRALRGRPCRGRGDRPARPATRASSRCCCRSAPPSRWAGASTGRSTRPPSATACRSAIHFGGHGGHPITGAGWPVLLHRVPRRDGPELPGPGRSACVCEGVFERFPS